MLALGILSVAIPLAILGLAPLDQRIGQAFLPMGTLIVPLGIAAVILGTKQIRGMKSQRVDSAGLRRARVGQTLGAIGAIGWTGFMGTLLILVANLDFGPITIGVPPGTRSAASLEIGSITINLPPGAPRFITTHFTEGAVEWEYREVLVTDGSWVKEGSAVRWNRDHTVKLEEGGYRAGTREGEWIFRSEDGSIDLVRSGIYENDVRLQAGASPPGDYPVHKLIETRQPQR